jgi:hypothetical protein
MQEKNSINNYDKIVSQMLEPFLKFGENSLTQYYS